MATPSLYIGFRMSDETKQAGGFYFSENREAVEDWIRNGGKRKIGDSNRSAPQPTEDKLPIKPSTESDSFEALTERFLRSMNQFDRLIPTTLSFLPTLEHISMNRNFYKPIATGRRNQSTCEGFELYEAPLADFLKADRSLEHARALRRGRRNLPGMFLMGLISSYDAFLAQLTHLMFSMRPEMISSSEKNISFKDLVDLGSIPAARNYIIEKEVETLLRQSHHAQFQYLEGKLNIPLTKDLAIWPAFIEICERRNLFTHTNGVVSSQYLRVCSEYKVNLDAVAVGDQLTISLEYLQAATQIISELGLKLIQVIWRKLNPEETAEAAADLNHRAYELLIHRRYELARVMLEFGLSQKKPGSDEIRKMMVVNLSIAMKGLGDISASKKILEKEDWSASNDKFRICAAAVQDDIETVIDYLPKVAASGDIEALSFRDWPAFLSVREDERFVKAFELAFNEPLISDRASSEDMLRTSNDVNPEIDTSIPADIEADSSDKKTARKITRLAKTKKAKAPKEKRRKPSSS